jgi:hypothetical protein
MIIARNNPVDSSMHLLNPSKEVAHIPCCRLIPLIHTTTFLLLFLLLLEVGTLLPQ